MSLKKTITLFFLLMVITFQAVACEIRMSVADSCKKEVYKQGDEVIIEVKLQLIHRNCDYDISQTKISYNNLKIISATRWKEVAPGLYTRQVKARITNEKDGDSKLVVIRKCEKDGGYAECLLKRA